MRDTEDIKILFEEKCQEKLGKTYEEWLDAGPQTEDEAYARLQEIDDELQTTYGQWYEALGDEKEQLEECRDKLKAEYDFLEEVFGLEAADKDW